MIDNSNTGDIVAKNHERFPVGTRVSFQHYDDLECKTGVVTRHTKTRIVVHIDGKRPDLESRFDAREKTPLEVSSGYYKMELIPFTEESVYLVKRQRLVLNKQNIKTKFSSISWRSADREIDEIIEEYTQAKQAIHQFPATYELWLEQKEGK